jgi:hypothetical protein
MSDVNAFIDAIGRDVSTVTAPRVESLAKSIGDTALSDYVPKVSAFANQLVKEIIDDQSAVLRDFVSRLVLDLFQRYRPELAGELHAHLVPGGLELTGSGIRLDVKNRATGATVSSLDIPVAITISVGDLALDIQQATVKLDVVR